MKKRGLFISESERCSQELGMRDGTIGNFQISASSTDADYAQKEARPFGRGWCADREDVQPYLQVKKPFFISPPP